MSTISIETVEAERLRTSPECGLTREECAACAALPPHRRPEWRAGRRAAKLAAAGELGLSEARLAIRSTASGAPRIEMRDARASQGDLPIRVGITHRDGVAAAVADRINPVGIDLERRAAVPLSTARYFLTAEELSSPVDDLTILWALKEASWKALECPPTVPFTDLRLEFDDTGALRGVLLQGTRYPARASVTTPLPYYVLAVVWIEGEGR